MAIFNSYVSLPEGKMAGLQFKHAKTTVDMPKGLFLSTCQTSLSPSTWQEFVSVDMPKQRPIATQSSNLETSATRPARVLLVFLLRIDDDDDDDEGDETQVSDFPGHK